MDVPNVNVYVILRCRLWAMRRLIIYFHHDQDWRTSNSRRISKGCFGSYEKVPFGKQHSSPSFSSEHGKINGINGLVQGKFSGKPYRKNGKIAMVPCRFSRKPSSWAPELPVFSQVAWRKSDKQPVDVPWMASSESEKGTLIAQNTSYKY